jgi:hypothetical protein
MRIDCAALVTVAPVAAATGDRVWLYPLPKGKLTTRPQPCRDESFGKFRQSINRHVDCNHGRNGRKARTIRASQDRQPKSKHMSGCVAKQRDHRAWFARTQIEVQNSTCVERQKEARICIGMQDGIPDDQ